MSWNRSRTSLFVSKAALSNPFATCHMWRMAILMWRMALCLSTSISESFWKKLSHNHTFYLISHHLVKNQTILIKVTLDISFLMDATKCFRYFLKMSQMDTLIRHKCGEHQNTVGCRCSKVTSPKISFWYVDSFQRKQKKSIII